MIQVHHRPLTIAEYQQLRSTTDWLPVPDTDLSQALAGDLFSVCVYDDGTLVGMGRVIGDGVIYFYVQDIIVTPEYQNSGIGTTIMNAIEDFLKRHAGPHAFIGLMAAKGVSAYYKKFGYRVRPDEGPGMFKYGHEL